MRPRTSPGWERSPTGAAGRVTVGQAGTHFYPFIEGPMVWLAVVLVVAWLLGWGVFHVAGGLIHLLLVVAVVVFLINFISGRRTV